MPKAEIEAAIADFRNCAKAIQGTLHASPMDRLTNPFGIYMANFIRSGGELAVTALERLAEIEADRRAAAEAHDRSMRRLSWVVSIATAVYALASIAFYWHEWSRPPPQAPIVNITVPK